MKQYVSAFLFMFFAAAMQWVSLSLFNSLALSFLLYTLVGCVAVPLGFMLFAEKVPLRQIPALLRLTPVSRKQAAFAFVLGTSMALTMVVAFLFLGSVFMKDNQAVRVVGQWGIRKDLSAMFFFAMLTLNGGTEEFFWRGFIHRRLQIGKIRWLAVGFPALVFGAQHIFVITRLVPNAFTVALFMFAIIGSGFLWGIIREKTGSLFTCAVCHMIVAVGYLGIFAVYLFG